MYHVLLDGSLVKRDSDTIAVGGMAQRWLSSRYCWIIARINLLLVCTGGITGCGLLAPSPDTIEGRLEIVREARERYEDIRTEQRLRVGTRRIAPLPPPELVRNPAVDRELRYFTAKDRRYIEISLERREQYLSVVLEIFRDEGVPQELINVAVVESAFDREARSHSGAVGLWQFMKSTGRIYGLRAGFFNDQRKDPILSTIAAARHLRDLYLAYNDWYLALAAYNAGSGAIDRAVIRAQSKDFWEIRRRGLLRSETARYVPRFIAATIVMNNLEKYGFASHAGAVGSAEAGLGSLR